MGNIARPITILWEKWYMKQGIVCSWCLQRNATFELAIYHLSKSKSVVANGPKQEMTVRGAKYLSVKLCKQCLPATTFTDFAKELHEESERRRKEKHL